MKASKNHNILHNRIILYVIFIIALFDLLSFLYVYDYYSASIFVIIGFLTSFFSKNMIVILFISIAFTNIIKYGSKASVEGMDSGDKESESNEEEKKDNDLSVETNDGSNKEKFEQDKNIVYTSEEEKEIAKADKMILSQERILKSMNKYKPLLDTLQGITKNMAIVKGSASSSDE